MTVYASTEKAVADLNKGIQRIAALEAALWKFAEFGRWFDTLEDETPIPLPHVPDTRPNDLVARDFCAALDLLIGKQPPETRSNQDKP